jgi:hypothetical protein
MVGAVGAAFAESLEKETDAQYRLFKQLADLTDGETDMPSRATLRLLALAELVRKGAANTLADTTAPVTDLTITHHHGPDNPASDDCDDCDGADDHAGCGDQCDRSDRSDRSTDEVTDLLASLQNEHHNTRRWERDGWRAEACNDEFVTLDGTILTGEELRCRICDPVISILRFSGNNAVLNLQRTQRLANREQRRALAARDGGCIFPGCDCPISWTDKHHVDDWDHGGLTDLRNFASLCRFHHGVTHRKGWTMVANGDGTFTWTTPHGRTLHSQSHTTRTRGSPQLLVS